MAILKATKYHGRAGFARVWAKASHRVHLEMLAKPFPRQLVPEPNPKFWRPVPFRIEKATLNHQPSRRLKLLSQVPPGKFTDKYLPSIQPEHYVQEYNLTYMPTPRIEEISMPRKLMKRKDKIKLCKKNRKSGGKGRVAGKKPPKEMNQRKEWLDLRAVPRTIPPPPPIPKWERRTKPLTREERRMRLAELAIPMPRYLEKPPSWDPYQVSKKAQKALTSKRVKELAEPRELPDEARLDLAFKPFTIRKAALKYKATKRVKELSEPVVQRKAADNDLKEDAFTVPKRALKAVCSKRTKELAKPIVRKGVD